MGPKVPSVSETELDALKALWGLTAGTVRAVQAALADQGRRWAYTTVQTLLGRLAAKGLVARDTTAQPHVYRPAVSREQMAQGRLSDLAEQLDYATAPPLLLALVENQRFTPEELERFRRLLDQMDPDRREG